MRERVSRKERRESEQNKWGNFLPKPQYSVLIPSAVAISKNLSYCTKPDGGVFF